MPTQHESFDERNRGIEGDAHDARDEDRGPCGLVLPDRDGARDLHPERLGVPAEVVADDRADHCQDARDLQRREDEWQRRRNPHTTEDLPLGRRVDRISSIDSGRTDVSPRRVFTSTGKKQSTAVIVIFDHELRMPNHAFVIGAKAMIGTALAAIMYGISAFPNGRQRASTSGKAERDAAADREPGRVRP